MEEKTLALVSFPFAVIGNVYSGSQVMVGKSRQQELEAAGSITPTVRKQRRVNMFYCSALSPLM